MLKNLDFFPIKLYESTGNFKKWKQCYKLFCFSLLWKQCGNWIEEEIRNCTTSYQLFCEFQVRKNGSCN